VKLTLTILFSLMLAWTQSLSALLSPAPAVPPVFASEMADECMVECACGVAMAMPRCCVAPARPLPTPSPAAPARTVTQTDWQLLISPVVRALDLTTQAAEPAVPSFLPNLHPGAVPIFERNCTWLI
jgi:hypothetical protein